MSEKIEWKFRLDLEPISTDDFWYDLFEGGYIKPYDILKDPDQVKKVKEAIKLLEDFNKALEENDLIEYR